MAFQRAVARGRARWAMAHLVFWDLKGSICRRIHLRHTSCFLAHSVSKCCLQLCFDYWLTSPRDVWKFAAVKGISILTHKYNIQGEAENCQIKTRGKLSKIHRIRLSKIHEIQLSNFLLINMSCHSQNVWLWNWA